MCHSWLETRGGLLDKFARKKVEHLCRNKEVQMMSKTSSWEFLARDQSHRLAFRIEGCLAFEREKEKNEVDENRQASEGWAAA